MIEYKYCGAQRRLLAYIIDNILLLIMTAIAILLMCAIINYYQFSALKFKIQYLPPLTWGNIFYLLGTLYIISPIIVLAFFDSSSCYSTPGKYFLNIKIINYDEKNLGFIVALVRTTIIYFNRILIIIPFIFEIKIITLPTFLCAGIAFDIISSISIIFTKQKTAIHDIICNTRVVACDLKGNIIKFEHSANLINNIDNENYNRV